MGGEAHPKARESGFSENAGVHTVIVVSRDINIKKRDGFIVFGFEGEFDIGMLVVQVVKKFGGMSMFFEDDEGVIHISFV